MDGIGDIYENVRLRSDYTLFYDNVKAIVEHCKDKRADVMFNFVAIKENYHTMAEVIEVAAELGVSDVNITPLMWQQLQHIQLIIMISFIQKNLK